MRFQLANLVLALSLVACLTKDEDVDDDLFTFDVDCDDEDPAVNPDAAEVCDGIDNDCDGEVDEAEGNNTTLTFYQDGDGDRFGNPNLPIRACEQPTGYVDNNQDCDDSRSTTFPNANETCNGRDDDCNGQVDDNASDGSTWYRDSDRDGFGDRRTTTFACSAPNGYVANDDDCDDNRGDVFPNASEYCDGRDNDCNNQVDDNPVDGGWFADDSDRDGFGAPGTVDWGCDGAENELDCDDRDASEPVVVDAATGSSSGNGTLSFPYASVQAGIESASDCVIVGAGTYYEAIDFGGRDIEVIGVFGSDNTTINAASTGAPAVTFATSESTSALLQGFTLTGGDGHLEQTSQSQPCGVSGMSTCVTYYQTWCGGGIYVAGADPTFEDVVVNQNNLPEVSTSTSGNDTYYTYSYGGGVCVVGGTAQLTGLVITDNFADQGGGLYVDENSSVVLIRAMFEGNSATDGAAVQVDAGTLSLLNVISNSNIATDDGGSALVVAGSMSVTNSTFAGDRAASTGGVLQATGASSLTVRNSIVAHSGTAVGVVIEGSSSYTGAYNDVFGNTGGAYAGISNPTGSNGNVAVDPLFTTWSRDGVWTNDDLHLRTGSALINAGDPNTAYNDVDGSRNDMGAYGGPQGQ